MLPPSTRTVEGPVQPRSSLPRHISTPLPYLAPSPKPIFFTPGMMAMHWHLLSNSIGIPCSGVPITSSRTSAARRARLTGLLAAVKIAAESASAKTRRRVMLGSSQACELSNHATTFLVILVLYKLLPQPIPAGPSPAPDPRPASHQAFPFLANASRVTGTPATYNQRPCAGGKVQEPKRGEELGRRWRAESCPRLARNSG